MSTQMSYDRMFVYFAPVIVPMYLQLSLEDNSNLWHYIYAHLSFKGLRTLIKKEMVKGSPALK